MSVTSYLPTTPGRRGMTSQDFDQITAKKPLKSLLKVKPKNSGRNNQGRITVRHHGGGHRQFYRQINFNLSDQTQADVESIEYDPNRTARIARVKDQNNQYHYILASQSMKPGQKIQSGQNSSVEEGNRMPLGAIPVGSVIHAIELKPGKGAQLVRSAGANAQLIARDERQAQIKLPSGEVRIVDVNCWASIGVVGNLQHQNIKVGKAGRNRRKGIRPTVRGVVMNAADHPHGGGDGGRHGTAKDPRTPWGQKTLGYKTRRRKSTDKNIIRSRHQGKRR